MPVKTFVEEEKMKPNLPDFSHIITNNQVGFILRTNLSRETGGALNGRTMANLDCLGQGIPGRFAIGRKTAYPVQAVVDFLKAKVAIIPEIQNK